MKPKVAVHKFSSCDGCQVAFINLGEDLLRLTEAVDIVHFAEAGFLDEEARVDVAFVEGSVTTAREVERIQAIRERSGYLITIGACATAGGLQALRNLADKDRWAADIYAQPEYLDSLATSTPISEHVKVDLELMGCPVSGRQVAEAVTSLLLGVAPTRDDERVCLDCKRRNNVCVMVAKGLPCMGPVTRSGCDALCPSVGRDCYACYGPSENARNHTLAKRLSAMGNSAEAITQRFLFINNYAPGFRLEGLKWRDKCND